MELKQVGNLPKTILGICFLLFLILFSPTAVRAAFSCNSGTLDTTCNVNITQTLVDGETISGTGNLVIQSGGNLTAKGYSIDNGPGPGADRGGSYG